MTLITDLIRYNGHIPISSPMEGFLYYFTNIATLIFSIMYLHQMFYLILGSLHHTKIKGKDFKLHKVGIVICARNESKVIGNLIDSVKASDYPSELINIFVVADNCDDNTADIAREKGCFVFERFNKQKVGKGYALNFLFSQLHMEEQYADVVPEYYIILDADNIIKPNFITEMNKAYDKGYEMVTSYRNSKNFGKNWITAGYGYWFLHEARHLNNSRMMLKTSCAISGTGFLISANVVKEYDNWNFFTLTEDIQCSTEYALSKRNVGYCGTAELYDEQPEKFKQAWKQRERWAKGFYQVFGLNGWKLVKGSISRFACWDILTTIFPAIVITLTMFTVLPVSCVVAFCMGDVANGIFALENLGWSIAWFAGWMWIIGLLVMITEWKKIKTSWWRKILYWFTFPLFMATYIPISVVAMFKKIGWEPIEHSANMSLEDIEAAADENPSAKKDAEYIEDAVECDPETEDIPSVAAEAEDPVSDGDVAMNVACEESTLKQE